MEASGVIADLIDHLRSQDRPRLVKTIISYQSEPDDPKRVRVSIFALTPQEIHSEIMTVARKALEWGDRAQFPDPIPLSDGGFGVVGYVVSR